MLTEEQLAALEDILKNNDISDEQQEIDYKALRATFYEENKKIKAGKTTDPQPTGVNVDQKNVTPENTGSDSEEVSLDTYEKYKSDPDKYWLELRNMDPSTKVNFAIKSVRKNEEIENRKVELEKIKKYKLDTPIENPNKDLNWKDFQKNVVKNEDGSYTGANGRLHTGEDAVLKAYEDITYANNGLDFEKIRAVDSNIKENEGTLDFINTTLSRDTTNSEYRRDIGGNERRTINETYVGSPEDIENYPDYFNEDGKIKKYKVEKVKKALEDKNASYQDLKSNEEYQRIKKIADYEFASEVKDKQETIKKDNTVLTEAIKVLDDKVFENYQTDLKGSQKIVTKVNNEYTRISEEIKKITGKGLNDLNKYKPKNQKESLALTELVEDLQFLEEYSAPLNNILNEAQVLNKSITSLTESSDSLNLMLNYGTVSKMRGEYENNSLVSVINTIRRDWSTGQRNEEFYKVVYGITDLEDEEQMAEAAERIALMTAKSNGILTSEVYEAYMNAETLTEKTALLGQNPVEIFASLFGSSMSQFFSTGTEMILPTIGVGTGVGAISGGLPGAVSGLGYGLMSWQAITGLNMEVGNAYAQVFSEANVDMQNPEEVLAAFKDEKLRDKANEIGFKRGIPIALMNVLGAKAAGAFVAPLASTAKQLSLGLVSQTIVEPIFEGGGEFLAQVASGEGIKPTEIFDEMIGGQFGTASNFGLKLARANMVDQAVKTADNLRLNLNAVIDGNFSVAQLKKFTDGLVNKNAITVEEQNQILENGYIAESTKEALKGKKVSTSVRQRVADLLSTKRYIQSDDALSSLAGKKLKAIEAEVDYLKQNGKLKTQDAVTTITDYTKNSTNSLQGGLSFLKSLDTDTDIELITLDNNENPTNLPTQFEDQKQKIADKFASGNTSAYITNFVPGEKQTILVSAQNLASNAKLQLIDDSRAVASVSVAHEILHAVLDRTMTKKQVIDMGDKLTNYLEEQNNNDGKNISAGVVAQIKKRLKIYGDRRDKVLNNPNSTIEQKQQAKANYAQEVFTNISDEMSVGNVQWDRQDKNFFQRLANDFTDFFKYTVGMGDQSINAADIQTGEQAFQFLKDYNKTFFKGKPGKGLTIKSKKAPIEQGAGERESVVGENTNLVNQLKEAIKEGDENKIIKIKNALFENNAGLIRSFVNRVFFDGMGLSRKDFIDGVNDEVLFNINRTYDPNKNPEYGAYLSETLFGGGRFGGGRLGNILKALGQNENLFTSEIDDNKLANEPEPTSTPKADKPQIDLAKRLKLDNKQRAKVIAAIVKTLGTRLPSMDQKTFRKELEKSFANELKKPLADLMGTRRDYTKFLSDPQVRRTIIQKLPITTLVRMERLVKPDDRIFTKEIKRNLKPKDVDKAIAEGKLGKDTGRTTGPTLYAKTMPTKEQFLDFFDIAGSKKGTRKDKLAENLGAELAFDQTMDVLMNNEDARQRFEGIQSLMNNDLKSNYQAIIAKQIERDNPNNEVRASELMAVANDQGLSTEDLIKLLDGPLEDMQENVELYSAFENAFQDFAKKQISDEGINNDGYLARLKKDFEKNETLSKYLKDGDYKLTRTEKGVTLTNPKRQQRAFEVGNQMLNYLPKFLLTKKYSNANSNIISKVIYKDNGSDRGLMFFTNQTEKEQIAYSKSVKGSIILQKAYEGVEVDGVAKEKLLLNRARSIAYKNNLKIKENKINQAIKDNKFDEFTSPETKARWKKFDKIKGDLEVSNKTANKLGHIINIASEIANEKLTGKEKAAKLRKIIGNDGRKALEAGHALMEAVHSSWNDWVNKQVKDGKMTRDEAVKDVITNLQLTTNSVFSARAYAAFTSFYFTDKPQKIPKNLKGYKGEHVYDASNLTSAIVNSIANNTFNEDIQGILDGFEQSFIPKKLADRLDNLGGRNNRLKNLRFLLDPEIGKNTYSILTNQTMYEVAKSEFAAKIKEDLGVTVEFDENARESTLPEMSKEFNKILEQTKGVGVYEIYSAKRSKALGAKIGRSTFFIPPSAEDFVGLLYSFLDKGKVGEKQMDFFNKTLIKPFAQAMQALNLAQNVTRNLYNNVRNEYKDVHKILKKESEFKGFTNEDAVRVYMWTLAGYDIPGVNKNDIKKLVDVVNKNERMKDYAKKISALTGNPDGYVTPTENWDAGSILSDLEQESKDFKRKEFLAQWIENKNTIFGEENLNKIEAIYGSNFREALQDMLYRMENGTNRNFGTNRLVNSFMNWINNSVGAIMFFNARSAVLQTISSLNYINFSDNNPIAVAKTLLNQKQYWTDFVELFNSDFLKSRRSGLKTDVNASEIANYVKGSKNKAKAAVSYLLSKGFLPTQLADSFAIAIGGASMVRNRINALKKQGMSEADAKAKALLDWQELTEESQQSSRADRISQQQAGPLGRVILAFANTPMQYSRLMKKAFLDLKNKRGDWKTNMSKLVYYSTVQNFAFNALQQALFALIWEEDEDEKEKKENDKLIGIGNGMADSLLRGLGVGGAATAAVKNIIIEAIRQSKKKRPDYQVAALKSLSLSPPISSKINKLRSAALTYQYNKDEIMEMGLSLDNPAYLAIGKLTSAATNVPLDRIFQKYNNLSVAMDSQTETWQTIALALGWDQWSLGLDPYAKFKKPKKVKKSSFFGKRKNNKRKKPLF